MAGSSTLGSAGIVQGVPSHLPTWLDTEVSKVTWTFAVRAYNFAAWTALHGECSQGSLKALFFAMLYEVLLLMYGTEDSVRVKRGTRAGCLNSRLQLGEEFPKTIQEEYRAQLVVIDWTNSDNASVECVHVVGCLAEGNSQSEAKLQCFLLKHDLSMDTEVLVMPVELIEDEG